MGACRPSVFPQVALAEELQNPGAYAFERHLCTSNHKHIVWDDAVYWDAEFAAKCVSHQLVASVARTTLSPDQTTLPRRIVLKRPH